MKQRYLFLVVSSILMGSCDLVTPDEIINPNVDESAFLNSDNPMETWVNGTEKEFALHMSDFVELMEILSDNYFKSRADVDAGNLRRDVSIACRKSRRSGSRSGSGFP